MGKRKGGTPIEEFEDWARRMIDDEEDFDAALTAQEWRDFLIDKHYSRGAVGLSGSVNDMERQLEGLERGRQAVIDMRGTLSIKSEVDKRGQYHIHGAGGRFISKATAIEQIKGMAKELKPSKRGPM